MKKTRKVIPLNRVEGDLELHLEMDDHVVTQVRSVGTMYRGIENLMIGRGPMDSLVITPRICGICTTAHLNAAAKALDMAYGVDIPDNAKRLRNVTLMVEQLQNDVRHAVLLFMPDLIHASYTHQPLFKEAFRRYAVLKGEATLQTVQETKRLLEIIAILGGQWPHSSFMVPGGVVTVPADSDIIHCRHILLNFRKWYEERILGCALERLHGICSWQDLEAWLDESPDHHDSELGFFIRYGRALGLDRVGRAHDTFISCGGPDLPKETAVGRQGELRGFASAGFYSGQDTTPLNPHIISEDISSSFFKDDRPDRHPFEGRTVPLDGEGDDKKYTWAKAPRYGGQPAETGPLADMVISGHPLFVEALEADGASVLLRQMARLIRPAMLLPAIDQWLSEMVSCKGPFYKDYAKKVTSQGYGFITAPRGFLGHWLKIKNGHIDNYQVITPTAWNASPADANGVRGPWEEAIVGTSVRDPGDPIEVEHVVRSFDPCLVCTVHVIEP